MPCITYLCVNHATPSMLKNAASVINRLIKMVSIIAEQVLQDFFSECKNIFNFASHENSMNKITEKAKRQFVVDLIVHQNSVMNWSKCMCMFPYFVRTFRLAVGEFLLVIHG